MKIIKFIFPFIFLFSANLLADKTHPLLLENNVQFSGGELLVDTSENLRCYFIKPNWTNSLEVVSTWSGLDDKKKIGKSLGNVQIQKSMIFGKKLIIIAIQNKFVQLFELDSSLNQLNNLIIDKFDAIPEQSVFEIKILDSTSFYLQVNNNLYFISKFEEIFTAERKETNVNSFAIVDRSPNQRIAIIERYSDFNIFKLLDKHEQVISQLRLSPGDFTELCQVGNFVLYKSSIYNSNTTLVEIIDLKQTKVLVSQYFECPPENLICRALTKNNIQISYLTVDNNSVYANCCEFNKIDMLHNFNATQLSELVYEPICLNFANNLYFAVFRNYIIAFDSKLNIKLFEPSPIGSQFSTLPQILVQHNLLVIKSKLFSETFEITANHLWFFYALMKYLAIYLIPIILILIIYYFYRKYHKQKRLLNELIELPSSGLMIILNKNGEISRLNQIARELLGIEANIPLQRPIREYLTMDFALSLGEFVSEGISLHQNVSKRIVIHKDNHDYEYVFSISPIWSSYGNLKGYVLNGFDITEQLERKRLSNWAQLAHDMQTNLLTIRLNAEQMHLDENTDNATRKSKILSQVNLLQKRVRDIVTVGRSAKIELMHTTSLEILNEVNNEFDKSVFPNITILLSGNDFELYCDKPKLIRAIRNAVENGIKAIPDQIGLIELDCWAEPIFLCFRIKDNGIGMDEAIKKKILTPYFTTSKDGSGFGLGTMIIQQVVELHHGKMLINSEAGKGTEFILKIPRNLLLKEN